MQRIYDIEEIRKYIARYHLEDMIREIDQFGTDRVRLILHSKGESVQFNPERDTLVFLVEGCVKNCVYTGNGKKLLLHISENFEMLRDLEFLGIRNPDMEIETVRDSVFLEIDLNGLRDQLMRDPVFLSAVLLQLGQKLAKTTVAQTMTAAYPLESRMSSYLIYTAEPREDGALVFNENLTNVSELLGASYRHLLRVLERYVREGILEHKGRNYIIRDLAKLQERASDQPVYSGYGASSESWHKNNA